MGEGKKDKRRKIRMIECLCPHILYTQRRLNSLIFNWLFHCASRSCHRGAMLFCRGRLASEWITLTLEQTTLHFAALGSTEKIIPRTCPFCSVPRWICRAKSHRVAGQLGYSNCYCYKFNFNYVFRRKQMYVFTWRQRSCKPCTSYRREPSVRLSVCRPSHAGTEWKRRELGSQNLHRRIAQGL